LLQRSIGPSVEISTTFPLSLLPVLSDPNQLESALLNLFVNPRDAMPTVERSRSQLDDKQVPELHAGEFVGLSVKDEGEGAWLLKHSKKRQHRSSPRRAPASVCPWCRVDGPVGRAGA
jgi:nitrogen fixation/metabolism regulation signal transduction histidine kinase